MIPGLNSGVKKLLLEEARKSIRHAVLNHKKYTPENVPDEEFLQKTIPSFVTLKIHDELRGCIGSLKTDKNVLDDICDNAFSSAMHDSRFSPLTEQELDSIEIHISLLYDFRELENRGRKFIIESLEPGISGLIIEENNHRATFLPSVWEIIPDPELFLKRLMQKAHLPEVYWSDTVKVTLYRSESF